MKERPIPKKSMPEQAQNSPPTTPALNISSEYDAAQHEENTIGETTSKKSFSSMEEAYYHKYLELAEEYGTHILYDAKRDYSGHSYLNGVCIVDFMDFNGDGIQDLFVVYSNGQMNKIVIDNADLEIFNFPAKDAYEIEIWTYKDGELKQILHESRVSVNDSSSYSYRNPDELVVLDCQFSITVFENGAGLPVLQIFNYDERDDVCEYSNIYFSEGEVVRDKLTKRSQVFLINGSEITWSIWSENVAGYDKILLSALLAESWFGLSTYLLEAYGIDYNYTLFQTGRVIRFLSESSETPKILSWFIAEEEYISLYLRELYNSNMLLCEWEDSHKVYFDHHYNLYDIDQNGVPEFILYEGSSGAGTHFHFYTIIDGEIIYCGDYGRTSLHVNDEGGLIAYHGRMGGYHIDLLTLEEGVIETTFIAGNFQEEIVEEYPELDELGYENYRYLPFCPPEIPLVLYIYNQNLFPN